MNGNDGDHDAPHPPRRRLPPAFRRSRALGLLYVAAVGLAMAPIVGSPWGGSFDPRSTIGIWAATLLAGALWARVMRSPKGAGWRGWAASVPLAMLAAALASVVADVLGAVAQLKAKTLLADALMAASVYALLWFPVLLIMLLLFGFPVARARRLAAEGLARKERGERLVGVVCAAWGLVALLLLINGYHDDAFDPLPALAWRLRTASAACALLAGGAATVLAIVRERRRRGFVAGVEAGKIQGFRVDPARGGKVLVRLPQEGDYRAADAEEKVFTLDASGAAVRRLRSSKK